MHLPSQAMGPAAPSPDKKATALAKVACQVPAKKLEIELLLGGFPAESEALVEPATVGADPKLDPAQGVAAYEHGQDGSRQDVVELEATSALAAAVEDMGETLEERSLLSGHE